MKFDKRLLPLIAACAIILFAVGYFVSPHCTDCFRTHGWPYCYSYEGGFAGGGGINWRGASGDLIVAITFAVVIWAVWMAVLPRNQRTTEKPIRRPTWGWIRLFYSSVLTLDLIGTVWQELHGTTDPRFAPANQTEFGGMMFANVLIACLIAWLAISGIKMVQYTAEQPPS